MKKNDKKEFLSFIIIALVVCAILSAIGFSTDIGSFFIILIVICSISLLIFFLNLPFMKGKIGEAVVALLLKEFSKKHNGKVINDVIIVDEENKSSQIDHILLHTSGIYVIETKNFSGRIYGKETDKTWTQVLAKGKVKNKFYSPVLQNQKHVERMQSVLCISTFMESCIVLIKGNTKYIDSPNTFSPLALRKHILLKINEDIIPLEQVEYIYDKINNFKINPTKTIEEHVNAIKEFKNSLICPFCNGELIKRQSKNGKKFYGCSNFPKCKFTKQINEKEC